jgi:hypothetical protein
MFSLRIRDNAVDIATGYGLDDRGVGVQSGRVKNVLFFTSSKMALGPTQPPMQGVRGFPQV